MSAQIDEMRKLQKQQKDLHAYATTLAQQIQDRRLSWALIITDEKTGCFAATFGASAPVLAAQAEELQRGVHAKLLKEISLLRKQLKERGETWQDEGVVN